MEKLGHAIIGYGGMGNWHHENIRTRLPILQVKGAYDIREEAREKARANGIYAYSSLEELWNDKDVSLVTIAVPNNYHKELTIQALRAGKNVICEKPVAMNAAELEEMIAVAKETGMLFTIHQNRRWDTDYRIVREILRSGVIGKPYFIESRVLGSRGAMFGWRGYRENGGGMVLDWGVHLIDQLLDMIDETVVSVDAHLNCVFSGEVDDNVKITLRFASGLSAMVEFCTNCFIYQPRWHVSGVDGTAVVENWECDGRIVKLNTDAKMDWGEDIVYTAAGPTRTMAPRPKQTETELPLPKVETDWCDYYKNVVAAIAGKEALIVKPEQALRVMRVIDLVFASEKAGHGLACEI